MLLKRLWLFFILVSFILLLNGCAASKTGRNTSSVTSVPLQPKIALVVAAYIKNLGTTHYFITQVITEKYDTKSVYAITFTIPNGAYLKQQIFCPTLSNQKKSEPLGTKINTLATTGGQLLVAKVSPYTVLAIRNITTRPISVPCTRLLAINPKRSPLSKVSPPKKGH